MSGAQIEGSTVRSDSKEQSPDRLDVGLPRDGFAGTSNLTFETAAFQANLRCHSLGLTAIGDDLKPVAPKEWRLIKLKNLSTDQQAEVCALARALRCNAEKLSERYQVSYPRSLGDTPRFAVVGLFADGSKSSYFYNLPALARSNRCAEQGLVSDVVNRLSQGIEVPPLKSIILVGLASLDGSRLFRLHPNFCSPCRTSLAELIPFGVISSTTEVLSFSITMSQEVPRGGRRSTFGELVPHQVSSFLAEDASSLISPKECVDELSAVVMRHFRDTLAKREIKQLKRYLGQLITESRTSEERSVLVAQRARDKRLIFYSLTSSSDGDQMRDGRVQYASAATIAILSCLASRDLLSEPLVIDILPMKRLVNIDPSQYLNPCSPTTNHRRIDLLHHESKDSRPLTKFIQVMSKGGGYSIRQVNPITELPLAEGILYRGRSSLLAVSEGSDPAFRKQSSSELQFSSQQVYCTKAAAQMVGSSEPLLHGGRASYRINKQLISRARKTFSIDKHDHRVCRFCLPAHGRQHKHEDAHLQLFSDLGTSRLSSPHPSRERLIPCREYDQSISTLLKALLEGAYKLHKENALHKMGSQQPIAAYAIGNDSEGEEIQVVSSPSLSLFADSIHLNPLFNLCVELITKNIIPKEIHIGKRNSFTLEGVQYAELLKLLISCAEVDFPFYIHNFRLVRDKDDPQITAIMHPDDIRTCSARHLSFPLK